MADQTFTSGQILTAAQMTTLQANSGFVYIKSQTIGTAVSSVTVSGAFSADYDNYLITLSGGAGNNAGPLQLRLGSTVTGYYNQFIYTTWNTSVTAAAATNASNFEYAGFQGTNGLNMKCDVLSPFLAKNTRVQAFGGQTTAYTGWFNGFLDNTTQYTAFDIVSLGTMTGGTIRVYGYRN